MFRKFLMVSTAALMVSPVAVQAQELTAAEILALLQLQREQLANSVGENGETRTLEFLPAATPDDGSSDTIALGTEVPGDIIAASTDGMVMPEELVIDLTIFFEFDSALLKDESKAQVDALCAAIEANEAATLAAAQAAVEANNVEGLLPTAVAQGSYQIIGHTDASGSVAYNLTLSSARAEEVVRYMVRDCGIDGNLLEAVGLGEARPKDPTNPRADLNRRVEIQITL